jgi:hypothetical protein
MQDQANTTAIRVPWNKGKMSEGRTFPAKLARIRRDREAAPGNATCATQLRIRGTPGLTFTDSNAISTPPGTSGLLAFA